ncbi:hypothetical protein PVAND_003868 [Polypedilum vanderplanki]|uniref:Chitin-binding type-2 domain-containing protein n=1 Tax=Polypedilum vanderplanki TaxID=319348 RepID=A0A9J6BVB6_POLVA|nr:hypothetical protein PVAND_003868 [Polypedilum vanderplanki]
MWTLVSILIPIFVISSCSPLIDGNFDDHCEGILYKALPHPINRNLFIGCLHEKATVFKCKGVKEIFDSITLSCVIKDMKNNVQDNNPCKGILNDRIPILGNCTFYYYCEFERAFLRNCDEGYIFDRTTRNCRLGDEEDCSTNELETDPPTTDPPTNETEDMTEPTTTEKLTTLKTERTTKEEEIAEPTTQNSTFTTTEIPFTTTTRGNIIISFQCPVSGYGNIPHSTYCNRFYECIAGILYLRSCDENLYFDAITLQCTTADHALCANFIRCSI